MKKLMLIALLGATAGSAWGAAAKAKRPIEQKIINYSGIDLQVMINGGGPYPLTSEGTSKEKSIIEFHEAPYLITIIPKK